METRARRPHLTEYDKILRDHRNLIQQTAREQDILDGGTGRRVYTFTLEDAIAPGWGEDGAENDRNIRHLFKPQEPQKQPLI